MKKLPRGSFYHARAIDDCPCGRNGSVSFCRGVHCTPALPAAYMFSSVDGKTLRMYNVNMKMTSGCMV